jgi:uncharacterized protein
MSAIETCYLTPKLNALAAAGGGWQGVFCREPVKTGELLAVWGGRVVDWRLLNGLDAGHQIAAVQVEDGLFLAPAGPPEAAHAFNHSCAPNAGLSGRIALAALRDIWPGEEVCLDFATVFSDYFEAFACHCGSPNCRRSIRSDDWRKPELWEDYLQHFSPYLVRRIHQLQTGGEPDPGWQAAALTPGQPQGGQTHYLSPKLAAGKTPRIDQNGVFAVAAIDAGEILTVWGGMVVCYAKLLQLDEIQRVLAVQVEEGLHLAPFVEPEPADYFNHSCRPNAGLNGQNCLVAMRPIAAGEEVCFDYAMSDSTPYDEFQCGCAEPGCRGRITALDWRLPELIARYQGYYSPYLQNRIRRLSD